MNPKLPLIVGESNPYGHDPYFAMYPEPEGCSGDRLCRLVMGLRRGTYLSNFERANLLQGPKWSVPRAREAARSLRNQFDWREPKTFILLGRRVAAAFGFDQQAPGYGFPRFNGCANLILLPHPSGRNRAWSEPNMIQNCRKILKQALPDVPFGELDEDVQRCFEGSVAFLKLFGKAVSSVVLQAIADCIHCRSEPDYRGPCACEHAPCVHQGS